MLFVHEALIQISPVHLSVILAITEIQQISFWLLHKILLLILFLQNSSKDSSRFDQPMHTFQISIHWATLRLQQLSPGHTSAVAQLMDCGTVLQCQSFCAQCGHIIRIHQLKL